MVGRIVSELNEDEVEEGVLRGNGRVDGSHAQRIGYLRVRAPIQVFLLKRKEKRHYLVGWVENGVCVYLNFLGNRKEGRKERYTHHRCPFLVGLSRKRVCVFRFRSEPGRFLKESRFLPSPRLGWILTVFRLGSG